MQKKKLIARLVNVSLGFLMILSMLFLLFLYSSLFFLQKAQLHKRFIQSTFTSLGIGIKLSSFHKLYSPRASLQMPIRRLASFLSPSLLLNSRTKAELTNYSLHGARQRQTIDHHHLLYSNPINHRLMRTCLVGKKLPECGPIGLLLM